MSQAGSSGSSGPPPGENYTITGNSGGAVSPLDFNWNIVGSGTISVTGNNSDATLTIAGSGSEIHTITTVTTSPYTVLSTDEFLAVNTTGGAITILLPNTPATGLVYYIKDSKGNSAVNAITVTTVGGTKDIDGATSYVISTNYQSISVIYDGAAYEVF